TVATRASRGPDAILPARIKAYRGHSRFRHYGADGTDPRSNPARYEVPVTARVTSKPPSSNVRAYTRSRVSSTGSSRPRGVAGWTGRELDASRRWWWRPPGWASPVARSP